MMSRSKMTNEVLSLASGILGGAVAGAVFTRIWRVVSQDDAPEPTALDHDIRQVLLAGALQGAVFGIVKATLSRMTATGYRRFAGRELVKR